MLADFPTANPSPALLTLSFNTTNVWPVWMEQGTLRRTRLSQNMTWWGHLGSLALIGSSKERKLSILDEFSGLEKIPARRQILSCENYFLQRRGLSAWASPGSPRELRLSGHVCGPRGLSLPEISFFVWLFVELRHLLGQNFFKTK